MEEQRIAIVLVDASLELIPREIAKHPAVVKTAKRRGKSPLTILLDKSLHYHAMRGLPLQEKRGRPDIVYLCMIEVLESPLCSKGYVQLYLHTIDRQVIKVRSDVRLPKNYNRFVGLMEQLLVFGKVPVEGETLLEVLGRGLDKVVEDFKPSRKILLSERGNRMTPMDLAEKILKEGGRVAVMIGAFPHGDFSNEVMNMADEVVSIYDEVLEGFVATSILIRSLEFKLGLYDLNRGNV
ncbi:MAG: 16S rRNA methyltransferase [Candidatus Nezhaarchaeales archaeon]